MDIYAKCGSLEDARNVFDGPQNKDVVTWNAVIAGYAQLDLFDRMQQEGYVVADALTFVSLFQAVGHVAGLRKGKETLP